MSTSNKNPDPARLTQILASLSLTLCQTHELIGQAHRLSCQLCLSDDANTTLMANTRLLTLLTSSIHLLQAAQIKGQAINTAFNDEKSNQDLEQNVNSEKKQEHSSAPLQESLLILRLATYAMDAMRVLDRLQWHADRSGVFDRTIKSVCPDWRNPGCIDDPANLIACALAHATPAILFETSPKVARS